MLCSSTEISINISPFVVPKIDTHVAIVYPKQKPLYKTIPKTIGIPYYCCSKKPNTNC